MLTLLNTMAELQERRKSLGLSQAALARAAGISRTALSLIENGRLRPSTRTVQALERGLDPFSCPVLLVHGGGVFDAAGAARDVAVATGLSYALTLDVAAWLLTRYQTPATAWAYVRPLEAWIVALRRRGVRRVRHGERADLVLLRASDDALRDIHIVDGFALVSPARLLADSARLGGRHALDGARIFVEFPEARSPGLRLDADALLKVFEEVVART
jgi:transcriptional regulator with XRE-family HTH domain